MASKHLYEENTFTTTMQDLSDGGAVTVERDAYLLVGNGGGFNLHPSSWTVQIDGMVQSQVAGIAFNSNLGGDPVKSSKLTVGTEGTIQVTDSTAAAVILGVPVDVTNSGVIDGGAFGIAAFVQGPFSSKGFTITNRVSGEISGDIGIVNNTADPRMTVNNQGTITGAIAIEWAGGATITNTGTITGDLRVIDFTTVLSSSITNSGHITGDIILSDGDDMVRNTGLLEIPVLAFFDGKNSLFNSGTITGDVSFRNGDDTVTNSGSIEIYVSLGHGNNSLTNSGVIHDDVSFGNGNDKFSNTKSILGDVMLGDGNNTATNSGTIGERVQAGTGNDVLRNTGTIGGEVDLGAGNDTYSGGSKRDFVLDNVGDDRYSLGGGDDTLVVRGQGFDAFDGGAGKDLFDASLATSGFLINLGSKDVTLARDPLAAGSAFTFTDQGGPMKGFESVIGSHFRDLIAGGSAADTIDGDQGNDLLAGGLGADRLSGGTGNDAFIYFQTQDSGATRATRDTIDDFEGAGSVAADTLDLTRIDANTRITGDQDFTWIGGNTPFNHVAGELRMVTEGTNTVIQGDTNGDARVDFSILVTGIQSFNDGDFVL
jgi:serralysin